MCRIAPKSTEFKEMDYTTLVQTTLTIDIAYGGNRIGETRE